jgi:predicted transcriptional regulator
MTLNGQGGRRTRPLYEIVVLCHNIGMSPSPKRASRVFTISFPEELAKQVVAVAAEENRNISELFREAFRSYRMDRAERKLDTIRAAVAARGPSRYTEDDVEALVDEIRSEHFRQKNTTTELSSPVEERPTTKLSS